MESNALIQIKSGLSKKFKGTESCKAVLREGYPRMVLHSGQGQVMQGHEGHCNAFGFSSKYNKKSQKGFGRRIK